MEPRIKRIVTGSTSRFKKTDLLAAAVITALLLYHFLMLPRGFGAPDQYFYYTVIQRIMQGDRLLIDEWHLSQLCSFLQIIPYQISYTVCNGTNGIILCLRCIYFFCRFPIAVWLWTKLRRFGVFGLFAEAVYLSYIVIDISVFSYYYIALDGLIVTCALLFLSEKPGPRNRTLAGFVFACVVLAEPPLVFLYFAFCICVLVFAATKKRRTEHNSAFGYILDKGSWFFFTVGIFLAALLFFVFFVRFSDVGMLPRTLPVLIDEIRSFTLFHEGTRPFLIQKLLIIKKYLGIPSLAAMTVFITVAFICMKCISGKEAKRICKKIAFALGCVGFVLLVIKLLKLMYPSHIFTVLYFAPIQPFALLMYILCDKKNPAAFCFTAVGLFVSVLLDATSEVLIGFGGSLCSIGMWICFSDLTKEFAPNKTTGNQSKTTRFLQKVCAGTGICILLSAVVWSSLFLYREWAYPCREQAENNKAGLEHTAPIQLDAVMEYGPQKGLQTTKLVKRYASGLMEDINTITETSSGPLFIAYRYPSLYLYADMPYACYSVWSSYNDLDKQLLYWQLFPERIPKTVYLPFNRLIDKPYLDTESTKMYSVFLDAHFDYEKSIGKAGYILTIHSLKHGRVAK